MVLRGVLSNPPESLKHLLDGPLQDLTSRGSNIRPPSRRRRRERDFWFADDGDEKSV
jgi:hypothetical protein